MTPPTSTTGTIVSVPLPALGKLAPFSTGSQSKHTNMASDGKRIYVSGGDWNGSATDGTWSCNMQGTDWRRDIPGPTDATWQTLQAPHALQDNAGFDYVPSLGKFILYPGDYYAYDLPLTAAAHPILNFAKGYWWLDAKTTPPSYQQDTRLWYPAGFNTGANTGSPNGGIYDDANNQVVAFGDSSTDLQCHRWDVIAGVQLPDIAFAIPKVAGLPAAYFKQGKHVRIGRKVYILGFRTDGDKRKEPLFLCWDLDAHTMVELAPPPVDGTKIVALETRLAASHGKVVWLFHNSPAGDLFGIYVYDPASNGWGLDTQIPPDGNFICNSVCTLPDERVAFCGGVFGKQQTHFRTYEAAH